MSSIYSFCNIVVNYYLTLICFYGIIIRKNGGTVNNQQFRIFQERREYPTVRSSIYKKTFDVRTVNWLIKQAEEQNIKIVMNMKVDLERSPEYMIINTTDNKPLSGLIHTRCDEAIAELEMYTCLTE